MIATVAGGTGLTGSILVRLLLDDPEISRVICVIRRTSGVAHPKLNEVLIADLAELPSVASRLIGDLYFCCLGTTIRAAGSRANFEKVDHAAVVAFATAAQAHGARSFGLVTVMGANARSMFFYNRVKGRVEADTAALGFRSLTIFRPAFLAGPRGADRPVERFATGAIVPLIGLLPPFVQRRLVTRADTLAARMVLEGKTAGPGVRRLNAADI